MTTAILPTPEVMADHAVRLLDLEQERYDMQRKMDVLEDYIIDLQERVTSLEQTVERLMEQVDDLRCRVE